MQVMQLKAERLKQKAFCFGLSAFSLLYLTHEEDAA